MIQIDFGNKAKAILAADDTIIGLAAAGSWLTDQLDEFSDLDLIVVTKDKISDNKEKMLGYAKRLGNFLSGFTGEHVGEPRLLICLYDDPLLHVDLKFVTLDEFSERVETPHILLDKDDQLKAVLDSTTAVFPYPDYQWIEDRFWTWVHYALLKIGRGEFVEAYDFLGFLRMTVLGPLLHIKNGNLPRGVRRVETELSAEDFNDLKRTLPEYSKQSVTDSLRHAVELYRQLRDTLFSDVELQKATEASVMHYFDEIAG